MRRDGVSKEMISKKRREAAEEKAQRIEALAEKIVATGEPMHFRVVDMIPGIKNPEDGIFMKAYGKLEDALGRRDSENKRDSGRDARVFVVWRETIITEEISTWPFLAGSYEEKVARDYFGASDLAKKYVWQTWLWDADLDKTEAVL